MRLFAAVLAIGALAALLLVAQAPPVPPAYKLTTVDRAAIERKADEFDRAFRPLAGSVHDDLWIEAMMYVDAARSVLRFDEFYSKAVVEHTMAVLDAGLDRVRQLRAGNPSWTKKTGTVLRAYRSR